jgi:rubredoxin-NAD+ reductase
MHPLWCFDKIVKGEKTMKYVCDVCGWEYDEELGDEENGIAPGTKFDELPDDFECPLCGVGKDEFSEA